MLKENFDQFVDAGFDKLGAFIMVIDGFPNDERLRPTIELLEALGYQNCKGTTLDKNEYFVKSLRGQTDEAAMRMFIVTFIVGKYQIQYQPYHRCILRGKSCTPHRPESDFRFADWYPAKSFSGKEKVGEIEDQLADDFPNAASAAEFLHHHGFTRSNTHKRLGKNTYFVACRHGDGQPSGIVFRGENETYYFDYFADARFVMGPSGLIKDSRETVRQMDSAISLASLQNPF